MSSIDPQRVFSHAGTVQAGSGVYIHRRVDDQLAELCRAGTYAYVLTARQMGKSSLMVATAEQLMREGIRCATIDLNRVGAGKDITVEQWYLSVLIRTAKDLGLESPGRWWREHSSTSVAERLTDYFEDVVLTQIEQRVVVFIDELDMTLRLSFRDDFFAALRHLYNQRSRQPELSRLSFVLIGVATPSDLIENPEQTPFNIGRALEVTDFTTEEASALLPGMNVLPEQEQDVLQWVLSWTGGHPYLTQRLCRAVALRSQSHWTAADVDHLVNQTFFSDAGEGDDNLQFVRDMLLRRAARVQGVDPAEVILTYDRVRRHERVVDDDRSVIVSHLKLSGVVRGRNGFLETRNRIYERAFGAKWVRAHLPPTWVAQQLRRTQKVAAVATIGALLVTALAFIAWGQKKAAEKLNSQLAQQGRTLTASKVALEATLQQLHASKRAVELREKELRKTVGDLRTRENDLKRKNEEAERRARLDRLYREGRVMFHATEYAKARERLQQVRAGYTASGDKTGAAVAALDIAECDFAIAGADEGNNEEWRTAAASYDDAAKAARAAGDLKAEAYAIRQLGNIDDRYLDEDPTLPWLRGAELYWQFGDQTDAALLSINAGERFTRSRTSKEQTGELRNRIVTSVERAVAYYDNQGRSLDAAKFRHKILAKLHIDARDKARAADALSRARDTYALLDNLQDEVEVTATAITMYRELESSSSASARKLFADFEHELRDRLKTESNASRRGLILDCIAQLYMAMEDDTGLEYSEKSMKEYDAGKDFRGRATVESHRLNYYIGQQDLDKAFEAGVEALMILLERGDLLENIDSNDWRTLVSKVSFIYRRHKAEIDKLGEEMLAKDHESSNRASLARHLCERGLIIGIAEDLNQAGNYFTQALAVYDDKPSEEVARFATLIGEFYLKEANQPQVALPYFNRAWNAYVQFPDAESRARLSMRIGTVYKLQHEFGNAADAYRAAAEDFHALHNAEGEADASAEAARNYAQGDMRQKAIQYFNAAMELYQKENDSHSAEQMRTLTSERDKWNERWGSSEEGQERKAVSVSSANPNDGLPKH